VACVTHFKVVLLVYVVSLDRAGGYLLGNVRECAGRVSVITGAVVERISVWACLFGIRLQ
jgi:hypothetical protein